MEQFLNEFKTKKDKPMKQFPDLTMIQKIEQLTDKIDKKDQY
jgi:hypothetical protein